MKEKSINAANQILIDIQHYISKYGTKVLIALVILALGWYLINIISKIHRRTVRKHSKNPTLHLFVGSIIEWILRIILFLFCASFVGISSLSLTAVVGAIGLAIGFAMKDTLSSFMSGVMILMLKPFKVGDTIEFGNGVVGVVNAIQIFSTRILTLDNKKIVVPNVLLTSNVVINYSGENKRRVDMEIGIAYNADLQLAKKTITEILDANTNVLSDPAPVVGVKELADSAVILLVRPWCSTENVLSVRMEVTEKIKLRFDELGIGIPFPQRDVYVHYKEQPKISK